MILQPHIIDDFKTNRKDITPPFGSLAVSFTTNTNSFTGVGTMESATIRVIFPVSRQTDGTITRRTNEALVVRPTIR